jgi:glycosyltransferase involved in cell wall biosynthesis
MPHVLVIPSWYPEKAGDIGGSFFREQAVALRKRGYEMGVMSVRLSRREFFFALRGRAGVIQECDEGVNTLRLHRTTVLPKTFHSANVRLVKKYGLYLFKTYLSLYGMPDIIHVQSMLPAGYMAMEIAKQYGLPYIVTEHSSSFYRGKLSSKQLQDASVIASKSQHCFAVSSPFARFLEKKLECPQKWLVMHNIVSERFFYEKIGHRNQKFTFLSISLLDSNKRVDMLLKAFAEAFKENDHAVMEIGGDGKQRRELESLCRCLGIKHKVNFTGMLTREQVMERMAACDVFVSGSRFETFGVSIAEALALGKPVISTRCGGPEDIVEEGDGILVPVDDINQMAAAMRRMFFDVKHYNPEAIRASCKERFGEDAIFSQMERALGNRCSEPARMAENGWLVDSVSR